MGISIGHNWTCSSYDEKPLAPEPLPQPDPKNFKILDSVQSGKFLIVKVNYPDCTNYEGNKVLVYENTTLAQLKKQKSIDPHFCTNPNYHSPIARFVPNDRGWAGALIFVRSFVEWEYISSLFKK